MTVLCLRFGFGTVAEGRLTGTRRLRPGAYDLGHERARLLLSGATSLAER